MESRTQTGSGKEIREKTEECKKSGIEKKGEGGEHTVELVWLEDELLEERKKRLTPLDYPFTIHSFHKASKEVTC